MTGREWQAFLAAIPDGLPPEDVSRGLRFFSAGCCRWAWDLVPEAGRRAVIAVEAHLLGEPGIGLDEARESLHEGWLDLEGHLSEIDADLQVPSIDPGRVAPLLREEGRLEIGNFLLALANLALWPQPLRADKFSDSGEYPRGWTTILRDVFGPGRRAIAGAWITPDVAELARGIVDDRDFARMPILGDALEDAGCDDPAVLAHCRSDDGHVLGCWVLEGLLGRR